MSRGEISKLIWAKSDQPGCQNLNVNTTMTIGLFLVTLVTAHAPQAKNRTIFLGSSQNMNSSKNGEGIIWFINFPPKPHVLIMGLLGSDWIRGCEICQFTELITNMVRGGGYWKRGLARYT